MSGVSQQHFEKFANRRIILDNENRGVPLRGSTASFSWVEPKAAGAGDLMGTLMLNIEPCPGRDFTSMG